LNKGKSVGKVMKEIEQFWPWSVLREFQNQYWTC